MDIVLVDKQLEVSGGNCSLSNKVEIIEHLKTPKTCDGAMYSDFFFKTVIISCSLDMLYIASHKVEISERFKNYWTDFKSQRSHLKHVEKIDEWKLHGKNVDIQMANLMLSCMFLTFSNVGLFQLLGQTIYIVSPIKLQRKRTFEKLSTCKWTTNSLISKCFEFEL